VSFITMTLSSWRHLHFEHKLKINRMMTFCN